MRVSVLAIAVLMLAGCGSGVDGSALGQHVATPTVVVTPSPGVAGGDSPAPARSPDQSSPAGAHGRPAAPTTARSALDLVGRWTVTGPDVPPGTSLYVADSMSVFLGCGVLDADWAADGPEGLFVASSSSGDDACSPRRAFRPCAGSRARRASTSRAWTGS